MKTQSMRLRSIFALSGAAILSFFSQASAATYIWDNSNVTGTPTSSLDWFTGGPNALGLWTGVVVPVSSNTNTIQFFQNTTTALTNTATPSTQTVNLNNGGSAFQLGTLTLSGLASATASANLTMTISGDALNFSAATGTINLDALNATRTITYNVNSNIQLGTASSAGALTLTGNGTSAFNFGGIISELQVGGGSLIKSGTSTVSLTGANTYTGTTTLNAGVLKLSSNGTINTSTGFIFNGGGLTLTNVDSTEGALDRVSNSAGITSNGGTITYTNTSGSGLIYSETIGSVDLALGQLNTVLTNNMAGGGGNIQTLTLSGLTRTGASNTSAITFASGGSLNTTTNIIRVNGITTSTTAGEIIGPWATVGTTAGSQTDYAVYDSDGTYGRVIAANIAATAENSGSWISGANVTLSGATTLTATRTVNSLRYTGGALALGLGASTFNLETYGVLNGGSGTLTISTTGTGGLTTASGGGNLYLTTGTNAITVSAPINDNGGAVTLVKSGTGTNTATGTLTLSGTNTYSGGTVINAGRVGIVADANLGAAAGSITFNGGELYITNSFSSARSVILNSAVGNQVLLQGNANWTNSGALTGSGGIKFNAAGAGGVSATLTNTANSFTGALGIEGNAGNAMTVTTNSLSDSVGAGNIVFGTGTVQTFTWSGASDLTLDNRKIEFGGNGTAAATIQNNTAKAITINTDLLVSGTGAKTLTLNAIAGLNNVFAGNISDGGGTVSLTKSGVGTWGISGNITTSGAVTTSAGTLLLGGTNSYSGTVTNNTLVANTALIDGTTVFQGLQSLPSISTIYTQDNSSANGSIRLLDDGANLSRSGVNILKATMNTSGAGTMNIFVGNNGTDNLGSNASSTATGNTISIGSLSYYTNNATNASMSTNVTGANGYRLLINGINLNNRVTTGGAVSTANYTTTLNPTTAPLTLAGTITQLSGAIATSGSMTLNLGGTAMDNRVTGNIQDAADFPSNANAKALSLTKTGTSDWTFSGNNTYTGGTTITTGKLIFSGANALPTTGTVAVGANGILSLADGTARSSSVSALTLTSLAGLSFDWTGNNTGDQLTSVADITPTAGSNFAINLNRIGTPGGSVTLLTGGAGSTLSSSNFYLANLTDYTATLTVAPTTVTVGSYASQTALTTIYWAGNKLAAGAVAGVDNAWALSDGTKSNWSSADGTYSATALTPGATANVIFSNTLTGRAQQSTVLGADVTINSLVIADATAVTIAGANGAALTLMSSLSSAGLVDGTPGSAITVTSTANATSTISSNVNLGSNQTWNVASGKTLSVTGAVGGNYSLTKADAGTVILSGANTYYGDTTISAGILSIGNNTAGTLGGGNYAGNIINNGTLRIWSTSAQTLSGVISGSGVLAKAYGGTLTLSGANTYTGKTEFRPQSTAGFTVNVSSFNSVNGGTPLLASSSLGAPTTVANGTIDVGSLSAQAGTTINYTGSGETTDRVLNIAGNGSSTGTITQSGSGLLKFTSNVAVTPLVRITLSGTGNGEIAGNIGATTGVLTKSGTGTWTISGVNSATGGTTVSAGTLIARNASALGTGGTNNVILTAGAALHYVAATDTALNIGGTLTINGGTNTTIGGSIGSTTTSAQINVAGNALVPTAAVAVNVYGVSGVNRLAGTNTYTLISGLGGGATTLNNGTYTLGTVFNNTDFTVSNITKSTTGLFIDVTKQTALSGGTYYVGGLSGAGNVWAASNGSTRSNFSASSGGVSQALVPGSAASVIIDNKSFATSTVLGADMAISGLTISDNRSNFALNADGYGLTIGSGGITKSNTTTRTAVIGSNLVLGAAQTWSNSDTGNALVVSGIVTGANNLIVTGAGNTTVSGRLMTDAGTLTKNGAGKLTMTSSNTYTGATNVNAGTVLVNGSISSSSLTTVASTATIGGNGTVGALTVSTGGFISGGDSAGDNTSILNINGAYSQAGLYTAHIAGMTAGNFDRINVTGAVDISGGSLTAMFTSGSYTNGDLIFILTNDLSDAIIGTYSGLAQNATVVSYGGFNWSISYTADFDGTSFTGGNDIALMAIPEPKAALLGCLGVLLLLRRRR